MKKATVKIAFIFVLVWIAIAFCGCMSGTVVKYSFAENKDEAASIDFDHNALIGSGGLLVTRDSYEVYFLELNGVKLPKPEKNTYWDAYTIFFPAGVPLKIRVEVKWSYETGTGKKQKKYEGSKKKVFECPPLEAGKEYELKYSRPTLGGSGLITTIIDNERDELILKDKSTGKTIYKQNI